MATFVQLLDGGYINLDLVLELRPAGEGLYEAKLPGQQGALQIAERDLPQLDFREPAPPVRKKAKG